VKRRAEEEEEGKAVLTTTVGEDAAASAKTFEATSVPAMVMLDVRTGAEVTAGTIG
jgi:hypothetical protein